MTGQEFLTIVLPAIVAFVVTWVVIIWFLLKMNKKRKTMPNACFAKKLQQTLAFVDDNTKAYHEKQKALADYFEECKSNRICPVCSMVLSDKPHCNAHVTFNVVESANSTDSFYKLSYNAKEDNTPNSQQNAQNAKRIEQALEKYKPCQRSWHDSLMDDIKGMFN